MIADYNALTVTNMWGSKGIYPDDPFAPIGSTW